MKIEWIDSGGGSMGPNTLLKLDGKYVGHFYSDAGIGVDVDKCLADITARCNAYDALVATLELVKSMRTVDELSPAVHEFEIEKRAEAWTKIESEIDAALALARGEQQ